MIKKNLILIPMLLLFILSIGMAQASDLSDISLDNADSSYNCGVNDCSLSSDVSKDCSDYLEDYVIDSSDSSNDMVQESDDLISNSKDNKLESDGDSGNIIKPSGHSFEDLQKCINQSKDNDLILLDGNYNSKSGDWITIDCGKNLTFEGINNASLGGKNIYHLEFEGKENTVVFKDISFIVDNNLESRTYPSTFSFIDCVFDVSSLDFKNKNLSFINCTFKSDRIDIASNFTEFFNSPVNSLHLNYYDYYKSSVFGDVKIICSDVKNSSIDSKGLNIVNSSFNNSYISSQSSDIIDSSFNNCSLYSLSFIGLYRNIGVENKTIEINTLNNESAQIIITGDYFFNETVSGQYFIDLDNLTLGPHTIEISYSSDSNNFVNSYDFSIVNGSLEDIIIDFPKQINSAEYVHSDENGVANKYEGLISNIPLYMNGEFAVLIDGRKPYDFEYTNGSFVIYENFDEGFHDLTVSYPGDSYFEPFNRTIKLLVAPITFDISEYGLTFNHIYDAYGNLTIKVNGDIVKTSIVKNTTYPYDVFHLSDGWMYYEDWGVYVFYTTDEFALDLTNGDSYEVEAIYEGNYGKYITVKSFNLEDDLDYYIIVKNTDCLYDNDYISGNKSTQIFLPDIKDIVVSVLIDGEEFVYHDNCINISKLAFGDHDVIVRYSGENFTEKSFDFKIKVYGQAIVTGGEVDQNKLIIISADDGEKISLTLPKDAKGNLTVYYKNGSKYKVFKTVELKNGKASVLIKGLAGYCELNKKYGSNFFKAKFSGNYQVRENDFEVIINPSVYNDTQNFIFNSGGENGKLEINVTQYFYNDDNEIIKNRTIKFGNFTVKNGILKIPLKKFPVGYLWLDCIFYSASGNKIPSYRSIEKLTKPLIYSNDLSISNKGTKYAFRIIDGLSCAKKGTSVKLKVGSKTYKTKVGNNGWIKTYVDLKPGKYTVSAVYKGKTIKTTFTVKPIMTLKKVTVKRSAKKLVLTATLKKVNGKYLKGKKITFKFNGKKYTAKTNAKGVAKVTISKKVLKKLKVGKKITYSATYVKTTFKKTVKVKR